MKGNTAAFFGYDGLITSGTVSFKPSRFNGGGMRYLRFQNWLSEMDRLVEPIATIYFKKSGAISAPTPPMFLAG